MSQPALVDDVLDETVALNRLALRNNGFHLEPRCRVCRNDTLRYQGQRSAGERGELRDDPARRARMTTPRSTSPDRVTIDSIRNHTTRHFPVQNVAKATYRSILERRAQENGVDFVKGVATAITPMAFSRP